ncbi:MAG: hypothetical protein ACLQFR_00115 [Streptosporangiaceae bacterium]
MSPATARSVTPANSQLTVQLFPAALTLSAGELATVNVAISNTTSSPVRVIGIDLRVPAGVAAGHVPPPGAIRPVRAGGFDLTTFTLRGLRGIEPGEVDVLLEVRPCPQGPVRLITGSLRLTAGTASQRPQAAFLSFPSRLDDGQSGTAVLSISNPTSFTFKQVSVAAVNSEDVTLQPIVHAEPPFVPCPASGAQAPGLVGCLAALAPGATAVLSLQVTASSQVQTGTQHVAVVVASQADASGTPISSTVIATTPVQVTIFGVDALSPFGLGTLFVLPGLLTVLSFLVLTRYVYPRSKELPSTVKFTDPNTLLFVVPPAALAYLLVWLIWGINLKNQAGTVDVVILFGLGVGLGFAVWLAVALSYYGHIGRKQFRVSDSPGRVLRRLETRHARLTLPKIESGQLPYWCLSDGAEEKLAACPQVVYVFIGAAAAQNSEQLRKNFRDALGVGDIRAIRNAARRRRVRLRWQRAGGVTLLDRSAVQWKNEEKRLISEDGLGEDE